MKHECFNVADKLFICLLTVLFKKPYNPLPQKLKNIFKNSLVNNLWGISQNFLWWTDLCGKLYAETFNFACLYYIVYVFIQFLLIQQFLITSSVSFFISFIRLLSRSIQSISTSSAHFLDTWVISATTEIFKFIFGILTSNVKVFTWSHKRNYQKSVPVLPPDGHCEIK